MNNEKFALLLFQALPMVAKDKKGRWYCVFQERRGRRGLLLCYGA
jgi:hypothetical protein